MQDLWKIGFYVRGSMRQSHFDEIQRMKQTLPPITKILLPFFLMITWSPYALPPAGLKGTADAARAGTVREGNELGRSGEMQYEAVSVLS